MVLIQLKWLNNHCNYCNIIQFNFSQGAAVCLIPGIESGQEINFKGSDAQSKVWGSEKIMAADVKKKDMLKKKKRKEREEKKHGTEAYPRWFCPHWAPSWRCWTPDPLTQAGWTAALGSHQTTQCESDDCSSQPEQYQIIKAWMTDLYMQFFFSPPVFENFQKRTRN